MASGLDVRGIQPASGPAACAPECLAAEAAASVAALASLCGMATGIRGGGEYVWWTPGGGRWPSLRCVAEHAA